MVDLGEAEVVPFAVLDWERRDELAGVARQQVEAGGVGERAGECGPGVVDRLGRDRSGSLLLDHSREPVADVVLADRTDG